jgi:hypothetical protein
MKAPDLVPDFQARRSKPFTLAQILDPRFDYEGLVQKLWVGHILKDASANGAIAQPHIAQGMNGARERVIVL